MQQLLWLVLLLIFLLQQFLQALPPTDVTPVLASSLHIFLHSSTVFLNLEAPSTDATTIADSLHIFPLLQQYNPPSSRSLLQKMQTTVAGSLHNFSSLTGIFISKLLLQNTTVAALRLLCLLFHNFSSTISEVDPVNNDAATGGSIRGHHTGKQNCGNNHKEKRDKNKASSRLRCPQRQTTFSPTINRLVV
jgi:hypothetical protein